MFGDKYQSMVLELNASDDRGLRLPVILVRAATHLVDRHQRGERSDQRVRGDQEIIQVLLLLPPSFSF